MNQKEVAMSNRYINEQGELRLRPSAIGNIMANGKVKGELSAGGKTYIKSIFKKMYLGYEDDISSKEMDKGITQEDEGIELLNLLYEKQYKKNMITMDSDLMRGTCDILTDEYIRDVKLSWSKKTFPLFQEDAGSTLYEWQLRAYMMLYDREYAYLDYCLIQTNQKLIPAWESLDLHKVNELPLNMRVVTLRYDRDYNLESQIYEKIEMARIEFNNLKSQFNIK